MSWISSETRVCGTEFSRYGPGLGGFLPSGILISSFAAQGYLVLTCANRFLPDLHLWPCVLKLAR